MIVDVLRNDLGRVCRPGTVRVPRLCRLERTAAVQHLVSTVTGVLDGGPRRLRPPRGLVSRAARSPARPKIRAMEILEGLEPVRRGPYTGAIGWIGPDGAMQTSIVIRTFVADGRRLTLHVGGGITWKSDPAAEWEETVTKARGPLGAIGGVEVAMSGRRRSRTTRPPAGHVWVDGRLLPGRRPAPLGLRSRLPARRRHLRDAPRRAAPTRPSWPSTSPGCTAPPPASTSPCPTTSTSVLGAGIADLLAADGLDGPAGDASVRITVSRGAVPRSRPAAARRDRRGRRSRSRPGRSSPPPAGHLERGLHLVASAVRRDPANPLATLKTTSRADYVYARLEARRAGADDALFLTIDGHLSEGTTANIFLVRRAADDVVELATPSLDCAILPGTTRSWLLAWARARRASAGRGPAHAAADLAAADEAFLSSSVAGVLPVTRVRGRADRRRPARAVDAARASRPRGDDRAGEDGAVTRDDALEFIAGTRQLVDEGERLARQPVAGLAPDVAPALGRPARDGVGEHGPLPPRLADGRQAERHRPRPADDARRGGRLRPRGRRAEDRRAADEPRCRRAPGDAVRRRVGRGRAGRRSGDDAAGPAPDRAPDRRPGRPADDPALAERLAEARRQAEAHLDHDAPRAPRPEKMQR